MVTAMPSSSFSSSFATVPSPSRWSCLAITAALALACPTSITAFAPLAPMHFSRPTGRSSSRRFAVTDPDILLRDVRQKRSSIDLDALEKAYMSSASDYAEPLLDDGFEEAAQEPVVPPPTSVLPKRTRKKATVPPTKKKRKSRSSTMPGFSQQSSRQKAFEDGIKLMEQSSGRQFKETPQEKKKRRKHSSEQMYKTSASVPDSLVRFANEIHLVSKLMILLLSCLKLVL